MSSEVRSVEGARVLVTGGSGLIGRAVVAALVTERARVIVLDTVEPEAGVFLAGDVCDPGDTSAAMRDVDLVIHLAGIPGLGFETALETYRVNTIGTYAVLSAAAEARVAKVVYASSINAAGWPLNPADAYPPTYPFDEDSAPAIGDWYSLSKRANEDAAAMLASRTQTRFTGLRYPLVRDIVSDPARFGRHLAELMATDPARAAKEGWSYLDASDAARATVAAVTHDTPALPGILVAAPLTYLSTPTDEALSFSAPGTPRSPVAGTAVPIDLTRSRNLLGFEARVVLQDVAPEVLVRVGREVGRG